MALIDVLAQRKHSGLQMMDSIVKVRAIIPIWPRGFYTFFLLKSAEHEISPANKSQITNNCKCFPAKLS